jgi:hypothetical protein
VSCVVCRVSCVVCVSCVPYRKFSDSFEVADDGREGDVVPAVEAQEHESSVVLVDVDVVRVSALRPHQGQRQTHACWLCSTHDTRTHAHTTHDTHSSVGLPWGQQPSLKCRTDCDGVNGTFFGGHAEEE